MPTLKINKLNSCFIQVRGNCSFSNGLLKTQMVQFFRNSLLRHFKNCHDAAECSLNYKMLWSLKSEKGLLLCFCNWMVRSVCPTIFPIRSTLEVTYLFCNIGKRIAKIGNSDIGIWGILFPRYSCNNLNGFLEKCE